MCNQGLGAFARIASARDFASLSELSFIRYIRAIALLPFSPPPGLCINFDPHPQTEVESRLETTWHFS
jgi:hypothetical protein